MTLPSEASPDNGSARLEPVDARLGAFQRLLDAIDRGQWKAGLAATKELRSMGLSVVLLPPRRGEAGGR